MNKGQLVEAVQKKLGKDTSKAAADAALNAVIDCITKAVKKEPVQIIGFEANEEIRSPGWIRYQKRIK